MIDYDAVNSFIGRKWVYLEFDCWALVKEASQKLFNVSINDQINFGPKPNESETIQLFTEHKRYSQWSKTDSLESGCVVLFFNRSGNPVHIGLAIEGNNILHCLGGPGVRNGKARYDPLNVILMLYPTYEIYKYADNNCS